MVASVLVGLIFQRNSSKSFRGRFKPLIFLLVFVMIRQGNHCLCVNTLKCKFVKTFTVVLEIHSLIY